MCLAIPVRIVSREGELALIDAGGVQKTVSLSLVPEAMPGDYVIVHVGFALSRLDPEEAQRTLELFDEALAAEDALLRGAT
jgi:hydrogenase expression/formation protein HypC